MFKIAILIIYIAVSASPLAGHLFFSIYDSSEILGQYDFNVLSLYWQITVELSRVALAIILFGALLNDDNPAVPSLKMLITLVTLFFALSIGFVS